MLDEQARHTASVRSPGIWLPRSHESTGMLDCSNPENESASPIASAAVSAASWPLHGVGCRVARVIPLIRPLHVALRGLGAVVARSPSNCRGRLPRARPRRRARAGSTGLAWLPGAQQPVAPDGQARFWMPRGTSDPQVNQVLGARPMSPSWSDRMSCLEPSRRTASRRRCLKRAWRPTEGRVRGDRSR